MGNPALVQPAKLSKAKQYVPINPNASLVQCVPLGCSPQLPLSRLVKE
jgi:hypothetical protein